MKEILSIIIFFIGSIQLLGQTPSYYILGEDELANKMVFSIIQDDNARIWLSTNDGIYKYDGITYTKFDNDQSKKSSYFGLTNDLNGDVYCCNLAGQIFKIENNELTLFYTIPDSLLSAMVNFNFDDQNRLVFRTDNYYVLDPNPKLLLSTEGFSQQIPRNNEGELVLVGKEKNALFYWSNNAIRTKQNLELPTTFLNSNDIYKPSISGSIEFLSKNRKGEVAINRGASTWSAFSIKSVYPQINTGFDFYSLSDSTFWFIDDKNGAYAFSIDGNPLFGKEKLFSRYRISCFLEDREGNLWLPTFGKGIIVIPNKNSSDFRNHSVLSEQDLMTISKADNGKVLTSGQNGIIYSIKKNDVNSIFIHSTKVELLKYFKSENAIFANSQYISLDTQKEIKDFNRSLKDIDIVNSNTFVATTLDGVTVWSIDPSEIKHNFKKYKGVKVDRDQNLYFPLIRPTCVKYLANGEIWAGSSASGLTSIRSKGTRTIKYNGETIYPSDIEVVGSKIVVSTTNLGILIFENDKVVESINQSNSTISNNISRMKIEGDNALILSDEGIRLINLKSKKIKKIGIKDGLFSNFPVNAEILGNELWFVFFQGIQKLDIHSLKVNRITPVLNIESVLCNDKNVFLNSKNKFNNKDNEFDFTFKALAYSHRGDLKYFYRLLGQTNEWTEVDYTTNHVNFKSIEPGEYTFEVYAVNESGTHSEIKKYGFTVLPPYWKTTWFLIVLIFGISLIIVGLFQLRLRISRRRIELEKQLKTSEVTAIKAQMNPHFVFNALNSIQELIVFQDTRTSIKYLGKFSSLMRKFLNHSEKNEILLSDEIELLELYLELEKLRFGDEFEYNILTDSNLKDLGEVRLPGMVIQPFVENAIKHGLLHSKNDKKLQIEFTKAEEYLVCTIEDNGIGIENSKRINEQDPAKHQSFASGATNKRISLLNQLSSQKILLTIENSTENTTNPGTLVTIQFPI